VETVEPNHVCHRESSVLPKVGVVRASVPKKVGMPL
jgi:hypothetical protein